MEFRSSFLSESGGLRWRVDTDCPACHRPWSRGPTTAQKRTWPQRSAQLTLRALVNTNPTRMQYRARVESRWDPQALERFIEWATQVGSRRAIGGYSTGHVIFEFKPAVDPSQAIGKLEASLANLGLSGTVGHYGQVLEVVPKGVNRVAVAVFLHKQPNHPGPLMFCGSTELNLNLFERADYPVSMANSPMGFDAPGIPAEHIYLTANNGLAGISEALMRVEFNNPRVLDKERP